MSMPVVRIGHALALGAEAGERRLAEVIRSGGFTRVRRAAQPPLNTVLRAI